MLSKTTLTVGGGGICYQATFNSFFFDVKVFNPLALTYSSQTLKAAHKSNENAKKRLYAEVQGGPRNPRLEFFGVRKTSSRAGSVQRHSTIVRSHVV